MSKRLAPGTGPTARRSLRVADEDWLPALERAERERRAISDVIRVALRAYADGRYHATEPKKRKEAGDRVMIRGGRLDE